VGAYGANPVAGKRVVEESGGATNTEGTKGAAANNPTALSSNSHALQIADMMRAIREGGTPLVDGNAARHPVEIIVGIYESARTHKEVTLS